MAEFDINSTLKSYLDSPDSIVTLEAHPLLQECENDFDAFNSSHANDVFSEIIDAIDETPEAIARQSNFDSLQLLLKHSSHIPLTWMRRIAETITNGLAATAESIHNEEQDGNASISDHKQVLERFCFLQQWTISNIETGGIEKSQVIPPRTTKSAKSVKGKTASQKGEMWDASQQLQTALDTMSRVMKLKISKIFTTTSERDTFIGLFTRPTYLLLESETRVKNTALRMHAFKVLCIAVKHHGHAYGAQTSIIQSLTYFEHLAEPMAELLNILAEQYDYPQLAEDVLKELSAKQFSSSDTRGPKSVSTFITRLSELIPRVVQKQVTYLAKLLETENYSLRCAIIEVCGNLIAMLSRIEEGDRNENHKAQINAFFDVLEERFLDVNPYCRSRAIQIFTKVCDLDTKYPKRRQTAAELATRSLEDKSSNVRRNAIRLLARLLATHPFALLHGGLLNIGDWQDRLETCENEINLLQPPADIPGLAENSATAANVDEALLDEPTQIENSVIRDDLSDDEKAAAIARAREDAVAAEAMGKLQLTRRYYVEALRFINTLHEAGASIVQLLGSKNKSEVIEAMDFFVVADAYNLEPAKKGIRRMLRLIWTKGNSDEGKGVQSHLVSCYKGLFFDAPGNLTPNDAANYIARNMISLTFSATSAELTSLEQLLATMMKEGNVEELVVQKLWQVYGVQRKEISKQQRRGAIIILGMLAVAEPQIIVKEMESCLLIGLGAIGRKDLVLARYTCVALMRMTESKLTKGTQTKPITRLTNEHAVLQRLAELVDIETEDRDWYSLAEQAIGAVYALSTHPDILCSTLIRRKTKAVFSRRSVLSNEPLASVDRPNEETDIEMSDIVEVESVTTASNSQKAPSETVDDHSNSTRLSQLVFLVGHVALKQIVHLETCEKDFKRRKADLEKSKTDRSSTNKDKEHSNKSSNAKTKSNEDELDLMAGTNEDDFADAITHIRERELLYGPQSLLRKFGPLVEEICKNNTLYQSANLQSQAALCMAKLMCVSSEFCETNLSLFITILERSKSPIIRSNLVVALADMAVCFNHLVDENTDYLYRRLSDHSLLVKVKGQLGDMAKCVEDPDERIREMSRMFFGELAGKDNAIYNHFVDMFSILSLDTELEEIKFHRIVRFLTSFIEKDKHAKQLASKLAPRLSRAETERQWNDIAFTIGLLPHKNEDIAKMISDGCKLVDPLQ